MSEIHTDLQNARIRGSDAKDAIRSSLETFGAGRSILLDAEGVIVAGNGVYEQAQQIGMECQVVETSGAELIVVRRTDLGTDDQKRAALALADNQVGTLSKWDEERLAALRRQMAPDLDAVLAFELAIPDGPGLAGALSGLDTVRISFGAYRDEIPKAQFERWIETIRATTDDQSDESVLREVLKRLGVIA